MSRKTLEFHTRQRYVVDAARLLIAEKGIADTSMDDIAAAADYTRRTLYAYFRSRDEILLMVLTEDLKIRWARQQAAMADSETGLDKLTVWAEELYRFSEEHPHSLRLQYFWDFTGIDRSKIGDAAFAAFKAINDDLADGLREIFRLGIADGSLRPDLPVDMCISQFLYSLRAILNRALATTYSFATFDTDTYVYHFMDLFSRGIRNMKGNE
jgi:AcrR family transcriptional regulator